MPTSKIDREWEAKKQAAKELIAAGGCLAIKYWNNTDAIRLCPPDHKESVQFEPEGMIYISEWEDAAKKAIEFITKGLEMIKPQAKETHTQSLPSSPSGSGEGQELYRWVKASDRLPDCAGDPQIHYRIDGFHKVQGNFHYSIDDERCEGEIVFTVIGGGLYADYQIPKEKWSGLEWLEKVSTPPSSSPSIGIGQDARAHAIGFRKFISDFHLETKNVHSSVGSKPDKAEFARRAHLTDDDLYDLYLQNPSLEIGQVGEGDLFKWAAENGYEKFKNGREMWSIGYGSITTEMLRDRYLQHLQSLPAPAASEYDELPMVLSFEKAGDKMNVKCPDEDEEFAICVRNKGARHFQVYCLTSEETSHLVDFLSRHLKNVGTDPKPDNSPNK